MWSPCPPPTPSLTAPPSRPLETRCSPYIRDHVDQIITIPDTELVEAFLDVMEKHKMVVENSGLLSVAALRHLSCQGLNVVCVLSGGNMDVITMASLVQHGLIMRGRIFTFSVLLPDRPGALLSIADILARENGNVIKLEHNQFVNINRQSGVELKVTPGGLRPRPQGPHPGGAEPGRLPGPRGGHHRFLSLIRPC